MTDQLAIGFMVNLPAAIAAVGALIMGVKNNREGKQNNTVAVQKADQIHTLVNSNLDAVKAQLAAAKTEIAELRKMIQNIIANNATTGSKIAMPPENPKV